MYDRYIRGVDVDMEVYEQRNQPFDFAEYRCVGSPSSGGSFFWWEIGIPGKKGTPWEGGMHRGQIIFGENPGENSPPTPAKIHFKSDVNVSGRVSFFLHTPEEYAEWKPAITVKQILSGVKELLNDPNIRSPAQVEGYLCFLYRKAEYERRVRARAMTRD